MPVDFLIVLKYSIDVAENAAIDHMRTNPAMSSKENVEPGPLRRHRSPSPAGLSGSKASASLTAFGRRTASPADSSSAGDVL